MLNTVFVVSCGGFGNRLWPISRDNMPKQFIITDNIHSTFQQTIINTMSYNKNARILVIGNFEHRFIIMEQLRKINALERCNIILEDKSTGTLTPALIACLYAKNNNFTKITFLPSDHIINNHDAFFSNITKALENNGKIVLFAINPIYKSKHYGQIDLSEERKSGEFFKVKAFFPNHTENSNLYWNSGVFVFDASYMLNFIRTTEQQIYEETKTSYEQMEITAEYNKINITNLHNKSIDELIQKVDHLLAVKCNNIQFSDVGSFINLYNFLPKDKNNNVIEGKNVITSNTSDCIIINKTDNVIAIDSAIEQIIVAQDDIVMVGNVSNSDIKKLKQEVENLGFRQAKENSFEHRPWGAFYTLKEDNLFKVKKIIVLPEKKLSLQMHHKRSEHWIIISGIANVTIGNEIRRVKSGQSVYIPEQAKHRIENISKDKDLIFIEVQCGSYFGEDDIVRFEDDFGRIK